jgi:phage terminase small subunit
MARKRKPTETLTARQRLFVIEYLVSLNATQAAIKAGYSASSAESQASALLRNPKVQEYVAAHQASRAIATGITQDRVLRELEAIAFSRIDHYEWDGKRVVLSEDAPADAIRAVSSFKLTRRSDGEGVITEEITVKLWDKPSAVKLAGRHVGLFDDIALAKLAEKMMGAAIAKANAALSREGHRPYIDATTTPTIEGNENGNQGR